MFPSFPCPFVLISDGALFKLIVVCNKRFSYI